jgi:UDP-glucose 4-epimerase
MDENMTRATNIAPPIPRPRRALITGGAGFIGSHLAEALLERGEEVSIIDDLSTGTLDNVRHLIGQPGFRYAIDTITNEVVMDRLASECDVIFHLAAAVGVELIVQRPADVIETNVVGTHAVLKVAKRYRTKVLIASTSELYGKNTRVPFREEDDRLLGPTTKSRWSYSESKAIDEFLGLAYHAQLGLPVVIFRLFNTVGPRQTGQYGMVVPRFVQKALRGEPVTVYGDGKQSRCFCNVEDTVRAIVGLSESEEAVGQIFNVGNTREVTIHELALKVLDMVGRNGPSDTDQPRVEFLSYELAYEAGFEDMLRRVPDISKIKRAIGWEPTISLEETLRRVIRSFKPDAEFEQDHEASLAATAS